MHYYNNKAESCHEVVGKNGKKRPTTLADARKLNLYPSVTTVMDIQAKPALVQWLQNQVLEAAIASPFNDEWYEDGWKKYIIGKSREIGEKAAKRGNAIHDALEKHFSHDNHTIREEYLPYINPAIKLIEEKFNGYLFFAEESFSHEDGFGGRVDLYGCRNVAKDITEYVIIDFKTKDKIDVKDMVQYDDHRIQLAAYQVGLQLPKATRRFNLFISANPSSPGLCRLVECKQFDKYKNIFYALLNLWQAKTGYKPEKTSDDE